MCGITGIVGRSWTPDSLDAMMRSQRHRGPDGESSYIDPDRLATLGHNRLSIIDLSEGGRQPMFSASGRYVIVQNGEIYNYLELRRELEADHEFRSSSDTEVLLAAYEKWGVGCLDRLIGMFAFVIWDERNKTAFAARDRFGVKPFYYHQKADGTLIFASEIKAIHAAGVAKTTNDKTWASYLSFGLYGRPDETFWSGIHSLPAGHCLKWQDGKLKISRWYDLAERVGNEIDHRPESVVRAEYFELMKESVQFRFRADVPVGINLSGGLDSSSLLGLVHEVQGKDSDVKAFTFVTGDERYDELPWVRRMLEQTNHPLVIGRLDPNEVPRLAEDVQHYQDEPFGGLPTLAYAKLFECAKENGVTVLLDGNGMDEQWAGYDYYEQTTNGHQPGFVQGMASSPVSPDCLTPEFRELAEPLEVPTAFAEKLRNLQYRDAHYTKIPRAMRFNDRVSMRASTELREPFLDHRLFELALRQPADRKISNGVRKRMLREIAAEFLPAQLTEAPKRPVQTPQREWLRSELKDWSHEMIETAKSGFAGGWLNHEKLESAWNEFLEGESDNSFYVWQWISLGLATSAMRQHAGSTAKV